MCKNLTKRVNPKDIAGNAEEEEMPIRDDRAVVMFLKSDYFTQMGQSRD